MYNDLLRKMADFDGADMPVLSAYLDMRPQATGRNPGIRSGEIVLKDRLHEIEKTYLPRGADLDSFQADSERILDFVENSMSPATSGLVIFACSAKGLWETVEVGAELENEVSVGKSPSLFQLAKMLDHYDTAVLAVVDTNTARFFVTNYGTLQETDAPNDTNTEAYNKTSGGGWSQLRYQRIVDNKREEFSKEVAKHLEDLIQKVDAKNLIVAGDDRATSLLKSNLLPKAEAVLYSDTLHIDEKAARLDIKADIADILAKIEKDKSSSQFERLISDRRGSGGYSVVGVDATKQALENGQVETLLLDDRSTSLDHAVRNELVKRAAMTGATVEMVDGGEKFEAMQGVAGLLRYKITTDPEFIHTESKLPNATARSA